MALPRLVLFALPAAAGALAWVVLAADRPTPVGPVVEEPSVRRPATPAAPPVGEAGLPRPAPAVPPVEPDDPEWATRDLPPLRGRGALRGSELVDTIEKAGPLRFRGASAGDLEALRRVVIEDVDRDTPAPYAAMMGWLKEAGFEVEVAYPTLTVRRRVDEAGAGR